MSLEVKDILWISNSRGCIGIALCTNAEGKRSLRISPVNGHSEKLDTAVVRDWGAKIPRAMVAQMILHLADNDQED